MGEIDTRLQVCQGKRGWSGYGSWVGRCNASCDAVVQAGRGEGGMCILNKETVWRGRRNGTYLDVPSESVVLESRRALKEGREVEEEELPIGRRSAREGEGLKGVKGVGIDVKV